ncbi:hypothetical protein [Streptomyces sp. NPDC048845]|uniref:hypothetical protein n=1 Tax=Streptomyces sp. NPDC048845 TaxID=3155390 RepID=UPI00343420BC
MTLCEFVHDAAPEYDGLAARLEKAMEGVPELVEEVTGLLLPQDPPPLLLLAGRERWHRAGEVHDEELVKREAAAMGLSARQADQVKPGVSAHRERANARWITVSGMLLGDRTGRPQLVAIADSLHHTGATDAKLVKLIAHELTHVAQHHASGGRVIDHANSWIRRRRPQAVPSGASLDFHRLTEGHAMWADRQITSLLGYTADDFEGTYTELGRRERVRWADEDHTKWIAAYESGYAFVRHVMEERGRDVVNRIWRDPERLCPTGPEVDAPGIYLAYLDNQVTRSVGLPPVLGPSAVPDPGVIAQWAVPAVTVDGQPVPRLTTSRESEWDNRHA